LIIFLIFILLPILELYFLVILSSYIGVLETLAIIIITGVIGVYLMKRQGRSILGEIQNNLAIGKIPQDAMIEGLLILASGLLMITPGIFTDCTGFLLLFPPFRKGIVILIKKYFKNKFQVVNLENFTSERSENFQSKKVIDGIWEEEEDEN
jgi:UPF0716 protein FxsA